MKTVIEHRPRGLSGFTMFKVGLDVYLKCNRCCRAWYRGQHPGKEFPKVGKADRFNLRLHADGHRGARASSQPAPAASE